MIAPVILAIKNGSVKGSDWLRYKVSRKCGRKRELGIKRNKWTDVWNVVESRRLESCMII